mmetsp:Transcript_75079/g.200333  ORF Transcript_75079/g.200333 Transcript_75079/m.200333 type:complete len:200 (+) Transcript_75079:241-840(+)
MEIRCGAVRSVRCGVPSARPRVSHERVSLVRGLDRSARGGPAGWERDVLSTTVVGAALKRAGTCAKAKTLYPEFCALEDMADGILGLESFDHLWFEYLSARLTKSNQYLLVFCRAQGRVGPPDFPVVMDLEVVAGAITAIFEESRTWGGAPRGPLERALAKAVGKKQPQAALTPTPPPKSATPASSRAPPLSLTEPASA